MDNHMRKFAITAASVAGMVAVVGMAPSALAANESVQLSSLDSGVSVSGTASTTVETSGIVDGDMMVASTLFVSPYSRYTSVSCADYGITLRINGIPQGLDGCGVNTFMGRGLVFVEADPYNLNVVAGDVISMTWGAGLLTSTGSLNGPTVELEFADGSTSVTVTPTLAQSSNSAGEAAPVLMWQQAYGRASATDTCQSGYTPSWDTWPNGGKGGFVCNRFVPEYGN
jgi:hypothetical protein